MGFHQGFPYWFLPSLFYGFLPVFFPRFVLRFLNCSFSGFFRNICWDFSMDSSKILSRFPSRILSEISLDILPILSFRSFLCFLPEFLPSFLPRSFHCLQHFFIDFPRVPLEIISDINSRILIRNPPVKHLGISSEIPPVTSPGTPLGFLQGFSPTFFQVLLPNFI